MHVQNFLLFIKHPQKMKTKSFVLLAMGLLFSTTIFAQRGQRGPARNGFPIDKLGSVLELTEEQKEALAQIETDTKAKIEDLRATDFESPEQKREALKNLMQTQREAVNNVLTEEQQAKLEALKQERKEKRGEAKESREALRAEMEAYRQENILPVMQAQRAKLEEKISAEDKATIAALRTKMEDHKADMNGKGNGKRQRKGMGINGVDEGKKADREQMKSLLATYQDDIKALFAEIEDKTAQWKTDMKAIAEKYHPEQGERQMKGREGKGKKRGQRAKKERQEERPGIGRVMSAIHFLLLEPATSASNFENTVAPVNEIKVFPNPAISSSTLQYNIEQAGKIRIELRNDQGKVMKTLFDGISDVGSYNLNVDTANLKEGVYYITFIDAQGQRTEKLVISR